ncbi:MAG: hypothetical protein JO224_06900 [Pelomonas sp.]|nr:hypothetical protein [Roseateles sp.]MBV8604395.1 hypothetical protein [Roseateles sp.]
MKTAHAVALITLVVSGLVRAAGADEGFDASAAQAERQALAQQRIGFDAQYAREQAACRERFAVSDCLDAARLRHSAAVDPLIRRQQALDAAERAARARAARAQTDAREAEAASTAAHDKPTPSISSAVAAPLPPARPRSAPSEEARRQALADRDAKAAAQASVERARQAARKADLAERQQQAKQQADERAAKLAERGRKPAARLPEPSASSIEQFKAQSQGASAPH